MLRGLRVTYRRIGRIKPWAENILQLLDWADWKTWVWYSLLGLERLSTALLIWAKRRGFQPATLRIKKGKFYGVPVNKKVS